MQFPLHQYLIPFNPHYAIEKLRGEGNWQVERRILIESFPARSPDAKLIVKFFTLAIDTKKQRKSLPGLAFILFQKTLKRIESVVEMSVSFPFSIGFFCRIFPGFPYLVSFARE